MGRQGLLEGEEQLGRDLGRGGVRAHGARQEHVRSRDVCLVPQGRQDHRANAADAAITSVASTHYADPKTGCLSDEVEVSVQGISGDMCSAKCGIFKPCPTDIPTGVTAMPQCALQDASSGKSYCALICSPMVPILDQKAADAQCGENASCKDVQLGVGICSYDD